MEALLQAKWTLVTQSLADEGVRVKWWNKIAGLSDVNKRTCYDLQYVKRLFDHYDAHVSVLKNSQAVALALFFQYLHYDTHEHGIDETKVLHAFQEFLGDAKLPTDSDLAQAVTQLLQAAINNCTEVHLTPGQYGEEDVHFFLDFDTAILGASEQEYQQFAQQMREEYHTLNDEQYAKLRLQILHGFLQIPNIFATRPFRRMYEEQARRNICLETERLQARQ